jgi:hypothetical protein
MEKPTTKAATRLAASHFASFTTELVGTAIQKLDISIVDVAIIGLVYAESTRPIRENAYIARKYGFEGRGLPNEYRPAVNLKFIYTSLGLSRETTRRKLESLVERKLLSRIEGGYVFLTAAGAGEFNQQLRLKLLRAIEETAKRVQQLDHSD